MQDFTCKNCKKRHIGCHGTCSEYLLAQTENARKRAYANAQKRISRDEAASETYQKEKAERPDVYGDGYDPDGNLIYDTWDCPRCGVSYEIDYDHYDYCPNCGRKIDWSDGEMEKRYVRKGFR